MKQDPVSKAVAVKLPENSPLGDWGVMTLRGGGHFATDEAVAGWTDL